MKGEMIMTQEENIKIIRAKRDEKVHDHLAQYAPVWMVNEDVLVDEDAVQFEIIFLHARYGWIRRRYKYDSYNNVLYHKGQQLIDEEETYELQATQEPYIYAPSTNTVNSYGG
jgi:hypothetical protein